MGGYLSIVFFPQTNFKNIKRKKRQRIFKTAETFIVGIIEEIYNVGFYFRTAFCVLWCLP